ncbi:MAG TPA: hypothetical protein ENG77_07685, partial [Chromatiales bacterium]|nr:hypothetical protein [Chromatiales bacterium]
LGWIGMWLVPLSVETAGFALLFLVAPRAYVRVVHAAVGGLFTTALFELSKRVFAAYVAQVHNYELLYGGLAVITMFLLCAYIPRVIFLLGAGVTYCLGARCHRTGVSDEEAGRSVRLAFRLLGHLSAAHTQGKGLRLEQLLRLERQYSTAAIQDMLARLEALRLVAPVAGGNKWLLGRDLDRFSLYDLYTGARLALHADSPGVVVADRWDRMLAATLAAADQGLAEHLHTPLASLLQDEAPVDSSARAAGVRPPPASAKRGAADSR